jgi:hypothetical protein
MSGTASTVFINEFHYDNAGADTGEFIEIAGPAGTDLTGWSVVLYNGSNGASYGTLALSGVFGNQAGGYGFTSLAAAGLQNGAPDGIALVNALGSVVQFISYEGSFTAVGGPANGLTSTDVPVSQAGSEPVGSALHLVGTGDSADDFTWSATTANTSGAANTGQSFTGNVTPGVVVTQSGGSTAVTEGGAGDSIAISLATQPSATVTVTLSGSPDLSLGATTLTFTPADWNAAQTVTVAPVDDAIFEGAESAAIGITTASPDAAYDGLVVVPVTVSVTDNDQPPLVAIPTIQGAGHSSAFVGQAVRTSGIVTAVDSNGYYLQDAAGDGDVATSDAIFVVTSTRPAVAVGDAVTVSGTVSEFFPGGAATGNLSTTQITATNAANTLVTSSGNALPDAVVLGAGGRTPPTEIIDDDAFASFDPATDGIDFYESLEGMRVTVPEAMVVAPTNGFGELWVVAENGGGATSLSSRGTLNIEGGAPGAGTTNTIGGDFNPERIQIDDDTGILAGFNTPDADVGDTIAAVTGVVSYNFGNFEILPTAAYTVQDGGLARETTSLAATGGNLLVATYNVLNLDPNDADGDADVANGQFARIATDIAANLGTPDIIALQEVQDSDGRANTAVTDATATLQALADAIVAAGGPRYSVIDNPFIGDDTNGGQPGANIRTAFLFNDARVDLVAGSVRTITDPATQQADPTSPFFASRLPLVADFTFQGETVTLVNNHFSSKGGSTPLFGTTQPAVNGDEAARQAQAEAVRGFVDGVLAADSAANVIVLGDLNEFEFEEPLQALTGPLTNLTETLPGTERYSFIFEGNSQSLDHILVSGNLAPDSLFDAVHINAEFADQASDHDPLLVQIALGGLDLEGGKRGDLLAGRAGGDMIAGRDGRDTLLGGGGADTLRGGDADDLLDGGLGADLLHGGDGRDTLRGGEGDDLLRGGDGSDLLEGGRGTDTLRGGDGRDTLGGGAGDDVLQGGDGSDLFVFGAGSGDDAVLDFARADRIRLADGVTLDDWSIRNLDGDRQLDTLLELSDGATITLFDFSVRNIDAYVIC